MLTISCSHSNAAVFFIGDAYIGHVRPDRPTRLAINHHQGVTVLREEILTEAQRDAFHLGCHHPSEIALRHQASEAPSHRPPGC